MKLLVGRNPTQVSDQAFALVANQLQKKPNSVFLLASGETPLGLYQRLAKACEQGTLDFSKAVFLNLDEYTDLGDNYSGSFHFFFHSNLFSKINGQKKNIFLFNPKASDPGKECEKMARLIRLHRPDLAILGIGSNGHVAFNEPGSLLNSDCRVVNLSESTRRQNSRFFPSLESVPKKAMTLGLKEILSSRRIVVLATGDSKALALHEWLDKPVSTRLPASGLSRHADCIVVADAHAAAKTIFSKSPLLFGSKQLWNVFNLPVRKKIVILTSELADASVCAGALLFASSRKNHVFWIVLGGIQSESGSLADSELIESQAASSAKQLGIRCVWVRSASGMSAKALSKSEQKKIRSLLGRIRPDLVLVPGRRFTGSFDQSVRKLGLSFAKSQSKCDVWGFEGTSGLFGSGDWNAAFEFSDFFLLRKLLAVRHHTKKVLRSRLDETAFHLAKLRHSVASESFSGSVLNLAGLSEYVELFCVEKKASK